MFRNAHIPAHPNNHWHTLWIVGIAVLLSVFALLLLVPQPKVTAGTYTFGDGRSGMFSALPLDLPNAPKGQTFHAVLDVEFSRADRTRMTVSRVNCMTQLIVNGQEVRGFAMPGCDLAHTQSFMLTPYLHPGENRVELSLHTLEGHVGVQLQERPTLKEYLTMLAIAVFLSWLLYPYLHPYSPRSVLLRLCIACPRRHRVFLWGARCMLFLLLAMLCMLAVWKLWARVVFELQGPFNADSSLYWAVGKGILNGLTPYSDLFETKPPGIFLISALSYWVTGGPSLGHVLQGVVILGFPVLLLSMALKRTGWMEDMQPAVVLALSLVFGVLFSLYAARLGGAYQVESFGAFFGALYLWVVVMSPRRFSRAQTVAAAACILLAVGLKEPFLLTLTAASVLVLPTWEDFLHKFLFPLGIAAAAGFLLLLLLGYLAPYLQIYIPEMLERHIHMSSESLLDRALGAGHLWDELQRYSPSFLWSLVVLVICFVVSRWLRERKILPVCTALIACAAALYLTSLSVGLGGQYVGHHFVVALPVYFALFVVFLQQASRGWHSVPMNGILAILIICGALSVAMFPSQTYGMEGYREEIQQQKELASAIDGVLERCSEERYLFLGGNGPQPYAYTQHSPVGPLFFQYDYLLGGTRTYFRESFLQNLAGADVVVIHALPRNDLKELILGYLEQHFLETPWPCAEGIVLHDIDPRYRMVFRVGSV